MKDQSKDGNDAPSQVDEVPAEVPARSNPREIREQYERENNCKVIKWADLMDNERDADLGMRLKRLARYGNVDSVMIISKPKEITYGKDKTHVKFYTAEYAYSISAHWKDPVEESYLGGIVSTRKPRPGESWNRGSDLPDGKYNDETWDAILRGIIRNEMKSIQIQM